MEKCGAETASDVCSSLAVVAPLITHKVLLKFCPTLEREFNLLDSVNKVGEVASFAARRARLEAARRPLRSGDNNLRATGASLLIENDKF